MPLGKGVRYRVKQTAKGPVRLAFRGKKVVEAKKLTTPARGARRKKARA